MTNLLAQFIATEDGAVTVDWVVLTAALIGLGMVVITPIAYSTDNNAKGIAEYVKSVQVGGSALD